ncbi:hypothetical protein BGZ46_000845 [Entomortierella lignicola]|nr:hypothetical protein BGZ46_000845 [Entomortierella lignicola]
MLPSSLFSPSTSHAKAPLNVVLIIDTYMSCDVDEVSTKRAVTFLRRTLVRMLLYFQCNMDAKFQWTYLFFNSRTHQDIGVIPNRMLQSLSMATLGNCVEEYQKIISTESVSISSSGKGATASTGAANRGNASDGISPCYNLRQQLVHSLADFGLDITSYQSPMKTASGFSRSQSLQKHFLPVSIRNYMYVISPLPRSWTETVHFLEGKKQSQNDLNMLGPRKSDILEVLKGVKDAFFEQGLWDRFLDQHTSLSWIDTSINEELDEMVKIYRSLQIHPGLGVKMSKHSWQAIPSTPIGVSAEIVHPVNLIWTGDLLCAESSRFICSIDLSEPHSTTTSVDEMKSEIDQIESIRVVKRISSRSLNSNIHSIRIASTMMCFPQNNNDEDCIHASYLLRSLRLKHDVLLLEVTFIKESKEGSSNESEDDQDREQLDDNSKISQYTRLALLHSATPTAGVLELLEDGQNLTFRTAAALTKEAKARPFSMAMMEKSWSRLGVFVDQIDVQPKMHPLYRLDEMPIFSSGKQKLPQVTNTPTKPNWATSKPIPGEIVDSIEDPAVEMERSESVDDRCLSIRKAYITYLYQDETVSDYVRQLNAASKDITSLAAKQSIPLKEAQQKLVAFIIEFLRIWPSKMGSKYKQIAKELNVGRTTESKKQDNYVILDDERPALDAWKAQVMKSINDDDVRVYLRKLKAKDTQIQIVQNLHILLLIDKYGLEENKPFKKDPGAQKTINLFMDELCIAASIEDQPSGLMSPQTPRSKDMDSAKKFFTRVIARYYEPSLPKVVKQLAIKCGVETSLLTSPRPSRGSKRAGMKRSVSLGVLQKPSRLDLSAAMQIDPAGGHDSSNPSTPIDGVPKKGIPMSRQSTSDNSSKKVLSSSIFRNRQVVMTRGSVQGVGLPTPTTTSTSAISGYSKPFSAPLRSKSMNSTELLVEDEDTQPKIAKLRLKQFYHDKESEEVLKLFRRQRPLSKADAVDSNPFLKSDTVGNDNLDEDEEDDDDDDDLGALGKYLPRKESVVPTTPTLSQRYSHQDSIKSPSTPSRRTQFRRYQSQQSFFSSGSRQESRNNVIVPNTPTRRSHIRGNSIGFEVLGSPSKRRRGDNGGDDDDDDDLDIENEMRRMPRSPSLNPYRRPHQGFKSPTPTWLTQPSSLIDHLKVMKPDRKRVHLDSESMTESSKMVLVPGTPSGKMHSISSSPAITESSLSSFDSAFSLTTTTTTTTTTNTTIASTTTTRTNNRDFLMTTPKSAARSAALAAAHFGLKTPEKYISSPTPVRQTTKRQIDFSLFSADD